MSSQNLGPQSDVVSSTPAANSVSLRSFAGNVQSNPKASWAVLACLILQLLHVRPRLFSRITSFLMDVTQPKLDDQEGFVSDSSTANGYPAAAHLSADADSHHFLADNPIHALTLADVVPETCFSSEEPFVCSAEFCDSIPNSIIKLSLSLLGSLDASKCSQRLSDRRVNDVYFNHSPFEQDGTWKQVKSQRQRKSASMLGLLRQKCFIWRAWGFDRYGVWKEWRIVLIYNFNCLFARIPERTSLLYSLGMIQEEYVKDEQKNLKRDFLRAQEEVKGIQSVPLVIGQFMAMVDQNNGIVGSTTGSNYYVRILSTINRELLKPSASVVLHRHSNALVDALPPEADSSISLLSQSEKPDVTYNDIGRCDIQKQDIREAVELPLTHHELYKQIGIDPPRGVLLYGPPGMGKTMLAKAVANHTTAAFTRVVGSEFIQKYLGEGPRMGSLTDSYELLNQTVNVKVIMATNRADTSDPALLRPGRLDQKIEFPLPDRRQRRLIFQLLEQVRQYRKQLFRVVDNWKVCTSKMNLGDEVDLEDYVSRPDKLVLLRIGVWLAPVGSLDGAIVVNRFSLGTPAPLSLAPFCFCTDASSFLAGADLSGLSSSCYPIFSLPVVLKRSGDDSLLVVQHKPTFVSF
ncbi:hypothetical protein Nepgr_011589 [Nepenthes gracilis]|uniref:AAA+ ATPase domain-containing protein n=1 Tax=Nepenthes gracilis TaxID=150966 RepID=A0AAD3XM30_NEPGR|nr:hypothetical protein Nepgr_011589 [Nepenthes gracilis]